MKKPVIGVIPQYEAEKDRIKIEGAYFRAIKALGGVPFLFPLFNDAKDLDDLLAISDGFLYTGGPDVHPKFFNEEIIPECGVILPDRDKLELELFPRIYKAKKPVLGICRGIQTMNIALGGSIYQDIKAQMQNSNLLAHFQKSHDTVETHTVKIQKGTLLYDILNKDEIEVNSFHHQSVKNLGNQLQIAASSSDGVIEAITGTDHPFFLGVQWHPEYLYEKNEDAAKVFEAFIQACL